MSILRVIVDKKGKLTTWWIVVT